MSGGCRWSRVLCYRAFGGCISFTTIPFFVSPTLLQRDMVAVVSNFEDEFTREAPVDSVAESSKLSTTALERTHFSGFTYVGLAPLGRAAGDERANSGSS